MNANEFTAQNLDWEFLGLCQTSQWYPEKLGTNTVKHTDSDGFHLLPWIYPIYSVLSYT